MHARNEEFLKASRVTRPRIWTGLLLNESYKVGSLIEQGATTELYDGTEVSTGEPVALKILLPQLAEDAKTRALFLEEARVLTRLAQPGLLRYRACAKDNHFDLTYIVADVVGTRLSSRLHSRKPGQQEIVDLTRRLAVALAAAHRAGVIHRNLTPHAVALPGGQLSEAIIADFNLVKTGHSGLSAMFDDAMVNHAYCAPEQLSTSSVGSDIGPWTDIYSLALVMLATMQAKPLQADQKADADLSLLSRKLRPVFAKMLEPEPGRRFQSMDEVVKQLDLGLQSAPLQTLFSLPAFGRRNARARPAPPAKAPPRAPSSLPAAAVPAKAPAAVAPPKAAAAAKAPAVSVPPKAPVAAAPTKAPVAAVATRAAAPARQPMAVPLATFHARRRSIGLGGFARRAAVGLSALLLAASPWLLQTTLPEGPADASAVPAAGEVKTASAAGKNNAPARAASALPQGRIYGADNTFSRMTLRIHRPARVAVHTGGGRLLFSRTVQRGDIYRAPSLPDLRMTTDDAGAVEVLFEGASAGFAGRDGVALQRAPLNRLASLAPRPAPPAAPPRTAPQVEQPPELPVIEFTTAPDGSTIASISATPGDEGATPQEADAPTVVAEPAREPSAAELQRRLAELQRQAAEPSRQPAPLAAAPEPAPAPPPPVVTQQQLPEPPAFVEVTPSLLRSYVEIPLPQAQQAAPQFAVTPPPAAVAAPQPRYLLDRLFPRRRAAATPAATAKAPPPPPPAPALTPEAAARAKAAAEMARATREAAQERARRENVARERSFFNTNLGVNSPY